MASVVENSNGMVVIMLQFFWLTIQKDFIWFQFTFSYPISIFWRKTKLDNFCDQKLLPWTFSGLWVSFWQLVNLLVKEEWFKSFHNSDKISATLRKIWVTTRNECKKNHLNLKIWNFLVIYACVYLLWIDCF